MIRNRDTLSSEATETEAHHNERPDESSGPAHAMKLATFTPWACPSIASPNRATWPPNT